MITIDDLNVGFKKVEQSYGAKFTAAVSADNPNMVLLHENNKVFGSTDLTDKELVAEHIAMGIALNRLRSQGVLKIDKRAIYADTVRRIIEDAKANGTIVNDLDLERKTGFTTEFIGLTVEGKIALMDTFLESLLDALNVKWDDYCDYKYEPEM